MIPYTFGESDLEPPLTSKDGRRSVPINMDKDGQWYDMSICRKVVEARRESNPPEGHCYLESVPGDTDNASCIGIFRSDQKQLRSFSDRLSSIHRFLILDLVSAKNYRGPLVAVTHGAAVEDSDFRQVNGREPYFVDAYMADQKLVDVVTRIADGDALDSHTFRA